MMGGNPDPNRVVGSWPGRGTGDVHYKTADGRVWVPASYSLESPPSTGKSFARLSDGRMKPAREDA